MILMFRCALLLTVILTATTVFAQPPTYRDPFTGMDFILVKGGCYAMGDGFGAGEPDELPVHDVCVEDFYLGKYEVTQEQWKKVTGHNPAQYHQGGSYPVEQVSWEDAQAFLAALKKKTGKAYRLPTEAEWEYAARDGGRKIPFSGTSDEKELFLFANYCDKDCLAHNYKVANKVALFPHPAPAGAYKANALGFYDMTGNVWEWCADLYAPGYYRVSPKQNPQGPEIGRYRALRGGDFFSNTADARVANRFGSAPDSASGTYGLRLVLPPH